MDQIIFKRKATANGGSIVVTIPPELLDFLDLKEGNEVAITANSKSRKSLVLWNNDAAPSPPKKGKKKAEE